MASRADGRSTDTADTSLRASTKDRLLDLAAERFAEFGYRHTSLAGVARELDITPSAVYFHFISKEELFVAAFDRQASALGSEVIGEDVDEVDEGFWAAALPAIVLRLPAYPLVQRVVRGEEPTLMPRLAAGDLPQRLRLALAVSLRKAQANGTIQDDIDCDTTAIGMESILLALLLTTVQANGTGFDVRSGPVRELLWNALQPR